MNDHENLAGRLTFVTLGARDLEAMRRFSTRWGGWSESEHSTAEWVAFEMGATKLCLWPIDLLAAESAPGLEIPPLQRWNGVTLALNVARTGDVQTLLDRAVEAGGTVVASAEERVWGGFSGYVSDPEGNHWEIAWAPGLVVDDHERVSAPPDARSWSRHTGTFRAARGELGIHRSTVRQDAPMDSIEDRLVLPFYLDMMGSNAIEHFRTRSDQLIGAGRASTSDDVVRLLRTPWRHQVMGAWFALFHDDERVDAAVLDALAGSDGTLTAPPLSVVAITLVGEGSLEALHACARRDVERDLGACAFVAAAIEHLAGTPVSCAATESSRAHFPQLLDVAAELRHQR